MSHHKQNWQSSQCNLGQKHPASKTPKRRERTCLASVHLMLCDDMPTHQTKEPHRNKRKPGSSRGVSNKRRRAKPRSTDVNESSSQALKHQSHFNKRTARLEAYMQVGKKVIKPEPHRPRLFSKMKKKRARRTFC
jgi:hypothetical protein